MQVRLIYPPRSLKETTLLEGAKHPVMAEIQQALAALGLYHSSLNGVLDVQTSEAIASFQESQQLAVTGTLNPITYSRLQKAVTEEIAPIKKEIRASTALARANILITKSSRQLTLFSGNTPYRQFPVAIGKPSTPTPSGNFAIATKVLFPGGVLGACWMGLSLDSYGIHGTNAPWLIGQMVSHGCIRMHNANAQEVFSFVSIGTPVYIRD